jgi:hypothetical protein
MRNILPVCLAIVLLCVSCGNKDDHVLWQGTQVLCLDYSGVGLGHDTIASYVFKFESIVPVSGSNFIFEYKAKDKVYQKGLRFIKSKKMNGEYENIFVLESGSLAELNDGAEADSCYSALLKQVLDRGSVLRVVNDQLTLIKKSTNYEEINGLLSRIEN